MTEKPNNLFATETPKTIVYDPALVNPAETKDDRGEPTGKKAYSFNVLFANDDPDLDKLRRMVCTFAREAFPDKYATAIKLAKASNAATVVGVCAALKSLMYTPFTDGDAAADKAAAAARASGRDPSESDNRRGKTIFVATKPELKRDGAPLPPPALGGCVNGKPTNFSTPQARTMNGGMFFAGAEVEFEVAISAFTAGKTGVKAYINQVYATGEGERVGGFANPAERFGKHVGKVDHTTQVLDDDIPF